MNSFAWDLEWLKFSKSKRLNQPQQNIASRLSFTSTIKTNISKLEFLNSIIRNHPNKLMKQNIYGRCNLRFRLLLHSLCLC